MARIEDINKQKRMAGGGLGENNFMLKRKSKRYKKVTQAEDDAYDKKMGMVEGSKRDMMMDRLHGVKDKKKYKKMSVKEAVKRRGFKKKSMKKHKNWIAGAIKRPGALHRALGVKEGKKIPAGKLEEAANKKGRIGKEARLAQTLKSFHKAKRKHKK